MNGNRSNLTAKLSKKAGPPHNTIRRYLRSGEVEPRFKAPNRPSKFDPFAEKLAVWLRIEGMHSVKAALKGVAA